MLTSPLLLLLSMITSSHSFVIIPPQPRVTSSLHSTSHFLDHLKFDGATPSFDVLEKTKEYIALRGKAPETIYDSDYVLRGAVIGPMSRTDLVETQKGFDLLTAFSDVETNPFGYVRSERLERASGSSRRVATSMLSSYS